MRELLPSVDRLATLECFVHGESCMVEHKLLNAHPATLLEDLPGSGEPADLRQAERHRDRDAR